MLIWSPSINSIQCWIIENFIFLKLNHVSFFRRIFVVYSHNVLSIYRKVAAVERVFGRLQKDIAGFQQQSSLHCLPGCGKCCYKSDISATVLEFLPFAYHMYKMGQALSFLERLDGESIGPICALFQPVAGDSSNGFCNHYPYRGLICRLFGYSVITDKQGQKKLVTCQGIKNSQRLAFEDTSRQIAEGAIKVPMMADYQSQLMAIDWELGSAFYPVNEAIWRAIEQVLFYYQYRNRRAG